MSNLLDLHASIRTRLEMLARDKHSSLLRKLVNSGQKSFIMLGPGLSFIKLFSPQT
jgi:hypothetical protein